MAEEQRPASFGMPLVLCGVALLISVTVVIGLSKKADCPNCRGTGYASTWVDDWWVKRHDPPRLGTKDINGFQIDCTRCARTGKVSLLSSWIEQPSEKLMYGPQ